jgi:hypothetical protein
MSWLPSIIRSKLRPPMASLASFGVPAATIACVDLASICPSGDEQSHIDALELTALIVRDACGATKGGRPNPHEVECRVYGGFRDVNGQPTERGAWLARHISKLRGLSDGIRIVPSSAESIAVAPELVLIGTYANQKQKMVDAMIAEDIGTFARSGRHPAILLISDDDDFVPAVLAASRTTSTVILWVRQRTAGRNDQFLGPTTHLLTDRRWL